MPKPVRAGSLSPGDRFYLVDDKFREQIYRICNQSITPVMGISESNVEVRLKPDTLVMPWDQEKNKPTVRVSELTGGDWMYHEGRMYVKIDLHGVREVIVMGGDTEAIACMEDGRVTRIMPDTPVQPIARRA